MHASAHITCSMKEHSTSGPRLDTIGSQTAKFVGEKAAKMLYAAVTFEVDEVRPVVDRGQCWRNQSDF